MLTSDFACDIIALNRFFEVNMSYLDKNIAEAEWALTQRPFFAASAERILILNEIKSKYAELPQPLRFSKKLSELLARVSTPIESYDLIAGRCVIRELDEREEKIYSELSAEPAEDFLGSGHCTYSWDMVVEEGLCGMREEAQSRLDALAESEKEKRAFLQATIEIYDAIRDYMLRYADEAERAGATEVAKNLRDGAMGRPDSFASALQLLWIITFIDCSYITANPTLTVGRLDVILYELYKKDIERGALTRERAADLITDYYCKHNLNMGRGEHQLGDESNSTTFGRILNFDAPQYLLLGGRDAQGRAVANELTELFAECIVPSFKNPVIVMRYVKDTDKSAPRLWRTLTDKALASSSLMFYNDDNVSAALRKIGLSEGEAREYAHFGCNWCSTGDNGAWIAGGPGAYHFHPELPLEERKKLHKPYLRTNAPRGWAEDFVISLRQLYEESGESGNIDRLYDIFFERMAEFIERKLAAASDEVSQRREYPSAALTFGDCFYRDSLRLGECFAASARYHFEIQSFQMFGTVVDCFCAVDKLVMQEKLFSLKELLDALEADFCGYEDILALCRRAPKYGNDDELASSYALRLSRRASELIREKSRPYFEREGLFLMPSIQSDTWHLKYGEEYGATPDGRRAGKAFSQNIGPTSGVAVKGLTALLNSVCSISAGDMTSGALNLDVDRRQFVSEEQRQSFSALLASYFNRGGLHAQISVTDADTLREAQSEPDSHRDVRVRVTGYSGIFVDMCERLQNDIINRFE